MGAGRAEEDELRLDGACARTDALVHTHVTLRPAYAVRLLKDDRLAGTAYW